MNQNGELSSLLRKTSSFTYADHQQMRISHDLEKLSFQNTPKLQRMQSTTESLSK